MTAKTAEFVVITHTDTTKMWQLDVNAEGPTRR